MSNKTYQQLAVFSILVSSLSAAEAPIGSAAPDFTIKDQYDQEVQLSSQRGKAVLLIYGDNLGSDYMGAWARSVRESAAASSVTVTRIANLRALPALLRSYVKRQFLKTNAEGKPNSPVLLDWDGAVAKTYGFTEDLTNVYLIDEAGILRYRASGKGTPEETRKLLEAIADLRQTQ
jgi:cytochrome oxidase Cu insertion factor (SCO1/SenC/PrrC family)